MEGLVHLGVARARFESFGLIATALPIAEILQSFEIGPRAEATPLTGQDDHHDPQEQRTKVKLEPRSSPRPKAIPRARDHDGRQYKL